jgi:hypothetical protein
MSQLAPTVMAKLIASLAEVVDLGLNASQL